MTAQQSIAARRKAKLDTRYNSQRASDPVARAKHQAEKVRREQERKQRAKSKDKK